MGNAARSSSRRLSRSSPRSDAERGVSTNPAHVVDRAWKIPEERLQGGRIACVESRGALRIELARCLLEAFGIAPGEDHAGALGAGSPRGFQPDAGCAADDDHGLAEQFR